MILQGYLARYSELGKQILQSIGRGENCDEQIQTYRELHRFKEYLVYLEQGENSWLYKDLFEKMENGVLDANEVTQRLGALRHE